MNEKSWQKKSEQFSKLILECSKERRALLKKEGLGGGLSEQKEFIDFQLIFLIG
jgi:hypothetical protein